MFVKVYRYKIKRNALRKWKKIMIVANKVYRKHGNKSKQFVLMNKEKNFISVIDMSYYKNKKEFLTIKKRVDKDKAISALYREFIGILHNKNKKFTQEDFELVLKS